MATEKLRAAERELLGEVEAELGKNPFSDFLTKIDSGNPPPADAEVRSILARGIPKNFGPSEESFRSLLKEIEAFKSWRERNLLSPVMLMSRVSRRTPSPSRGMMTLMCHSTKLRWTRANLSTE